MNSDQISDLKLENYKDIFESIPTSLLIVNAEGKIIYVNRQTEVLFGYSRGDLVGRQIAMLIPRRYRDAHSVYHRQFLRSPEARPMGEGRDLYALDSEGREFPVEIALTPLQTDKEHSVLVTVLDLSYRKKMEQTIRESEEKLQAIIDNSPDSVLVYDKHGNIISMNNQARKIFGDSEDINSIWDIIPQGSREIFSEILNSVREGHKFVDWESEVVKKDNSKMPASVSLYYVEDKHGMFVETIRDISDRVNLRNKILEYEKNKIVAKMSEGIAHHMGTPLASMLLRVQMMKEDINDLPDNSKYTDKLESVEKQILYGQKIMQKLLKFASSSVEEKKEVKVSSLIWDSLDIIKPLWSNGTIDFRYEQSEEYTIYADGDMIKLVLSDLLMNATDAVNEKGDGRITLSVRKEDARTNRINIVIEDTGKGISANVLPHVFEPFFTTKPAGKGTGLGLSVAKNIITDHNGEITIYSYLGHGTKVNITLPGTR